MPFSNRALIIKKKHLFDLVDDDLLTCLVNDLNCISSSDYIECISAVENRRLRTLSVKIQWNYVNW